MKLAFSTLGCPDWDIETVIKRAGEYGFQGLEIRGIERELDVTGMKIFTSEAPRTKGTLEDAGLDIICFSSSVFMSNDDPSALTKNLEEIKRYTELCETFNTPCIRIFGGEIGDMSWVQAIETAAETLLRMISALGGSKTKIVIETHDDWMAGVHFRKLMEIVDSDSVGVLWDVNHPYMFINEAPEVTWRETGAWVYHTHWKDSKINEDSKHGFDPCLMGEGVLPHKQIYDVLKNGGYTGYLSLEWEKMWHPDIPGPEIAFPQYAKYMEDLIGND